MQYLKIFILILILLGFANSFSFATNDSVFVQFEVKYKKAKQLYANKQYEEALALFDILSQNDPENPELHFYVGRCALELKNYDEAIAAFDRVLMLNPAHTRSYLETARVYYEIKEYELASSQLDIALLDNLPDDIKTNVMQFKAKIYSHLKKDYFSGAFSLGIGYDDNANNEIGNLDFLVPLFNVTVPGSEESGDTYLSSSLYLNHLYDFGEKGDWSLDTSGVVYGKLNNTFTDNNLALVSIATKPTYTHERYKVAFPLTFTQVYLSGISYSHIFQLGVEGTYLLDKRSNIYSSLAYKKTEYRDNTDLDEKTKVAKLQYRRAFGQNPTFLSLESTYEMSDKVRGARTDVTNNVWSNKISLSKEIFQDIIASLSYAHKDKKYKDTDVSFVTKRHDKQDEYGLDFIYKLSTTSSLSSSFNYRKQKSNQAPFTYDKKTVSLNYIKSF